jgi:hypothetical protein
VLWGCYNSRVANAAQGNVGRSGKLELLRCDCPLTLSYFIDERLVAGLRGYLFKSVAVGIGRRTDITRSPMR